MKLSPNQSAAANRPQALRLTMMDNLNIDLASDAPRRAVAELGRSPYSERPVTPQNGTLPRITVSG
jgi:hypothetical protein